MNNTIRYFILVLGGVLLSSGYVQATPTVSTAPEEAPVAPVQEDLRAKDIQARFGAVQTLQSHFVQEKHLTLLTEPVVSRGVFYFTKTPARIRLEYTEPFQNGFLLNQDKTYRLEQGRKKQVKNVMARTIANQMRTWLLFDLPTLSNSYEISYFDGGVVLTPKDNKLALEKITVWFSKDNPQALYQIRMDEPGGDFTQLTFTQTRINEPVSEEIFQ